MTNENQHQLKQDQIYETRKSKEIRKDNRKCQPYLLQLALNPLANNCQTITRTDGPNHSEKDEWEKIQEVNQAGFLCLQTEIVPFSFFTVWHFFRTLTEFGNTLKVTDLFFLWSCRKRASTTFPACTKTNKQKIQLDTKYWMCMKNL